MDNIQKVLIKAGRKDLAQEYYLKIAAEDLFSQTEVPQNLADLGLSQSGWENSRKQRNIVFKTFVKNADFFKKLGWDLGESGGKGLIILLYKDINFFGKKKIYVEIKNSKYVEFLFNLAKFYNVLEMRYLNDIASKLNSKYGFKGDYGIIEIPIQNLAKFDNYIEDLEKEVKKIKK
jgi:hypothetical protein